MQASFGLALAVLLWSGLAAAGPDEAPEAAVSWRAGAFLNTEQMFLTVGVGLQLKTDSSWTIEAAADVAVADGDPLDFNGLLGALPLSLAGLYRPLSDWPVTPFVQVGGGLNLIAQPEPEPFLLGGGGAAYQRGDWSVSTDLRFLFLPGSSADDLLDDRGLQMNLALQRGF